jgi:EAL domain-containing protein (putative c-di-GMP-specific phosphodiesterase class I)
MTVVARELAQSIWFLSGQVDAEGPVRCVPIHSTPFLIGRRTDLSLVLQRPTISTVHAEIVERAGKLLLRDLHSTNGSYVNGRRIADHVDLAEDDLVQFADIAFRLRRQFANLQGMTVSEDMVDRALALVQFDKLMRNHEVVPFFQPIIDMRDRSIVGYEVLGRSQLFGLESPDAMFQAAARLDLELELSRMLRWEGIQAGAAIPELFHLFVNTHPVELRKPGLIDSLVAVREAHPKVKLTLEIHESAVTDLSEMRNIRSELTRINISLAFDDFGAGQARLVELVEVRPDYLKFDMTLVRGINQASAQRQQMLASLVKMASELGSAPLAEGVETEAEHLTCRELGFHLGLRPPGAQPHLRQKEDGRNARLIAEGHSQPAIGPLDGPPAIVHRALARHSNEAASLALVQCECPPLSCSSSSSCTCPLRSCSVS